VTLRHRLAPALVLGTALALSGATCAGRGPAPAAVPCAPVEGELAAGAQAEPLQGEFRLSLTAVSGPRAGSSAAGMLRLHSFGTRPAPVPATAGVSHPLYGATDVRLAEVGAAAHGDATRDDPAAPGVLVIEWQRSGPPAKNEITLRLGADANRGGEVRFDGAHMALFVTSLSPERFTGRWRSGGGDQQAEGYFCAERTARR
jgi:hypothetical protein